MDTRGHRVLGHWECGMQRVVRGTQLYNRFAFNRIGYAFAITLGIVVAAALLIFLRQEGAPQRFSGPLWLLASMLVTASCGRRKADEKKSTKPPCAGGCHVVWTELCSECPPEKITITGCDVFATLWEESRDGLRLTDIDGRIVAVNRAYCELAGIKREELIGKLFTCVYPESERDQMLERYRRDIREHRLRALIEREWRTPDGRILWVEAQQSTFELRGQRMALASFRDATARKRLQQELERTISLAQAFLSSTAVGIAITDAHGTITRCNDSFRRLLGLEERMIPSCSWEKLIDILAVSPSSGAVSKSMGFEDSYVIARPLRAASGARQLLLEISAMRSEASARTLGCCLVALDLSRIEQLEQRLELRNQLDAMVLNQIETLASPENTEEALPIAETEILAHLANLCGTDHAYWWKLDPRGGVFRIFAEWIRNGGGRDIQCPRELPERAITHLLNVSRNESPLVVTGTESLQELDLKHCLQQAGAQSVLIVPVYSGGQCKEWLAFPAQQMIQDLHPDVAAQVSAMTRAVAAIHRLQEVRRELVLRQRRLEASLKESDRLRVEAERANRAKSKFLGSVSHEIRTPLNGVIGVLSLIGSNEELNEETRQLVASAKDSADALLSLLSDLIEMARLDTNGVETHLEEFSPMELAEQVQSAVAPSAAAKNLVLLCQFDAHLPERVRADQVRLRQVLLNLVGNAVKFTERGGVVLGVQAEWEENTRCSLSFSIRDSGVGIPFEEQDRIFEPFFRGQNGMTSASGVGLGLAISQRLVELMGVRISVRSQPGRGTEFHFSVPVDCVDRGTSGAFRRLNGKRILFLDADDNRLRAEGIAAQVAEWGGELHSEIVEGQTYDCGLVTLSFLGGLNDLAGAVSSLKSSCVKVGVLLPFSSSLSAWPGREFFDQAELFLEPLRWSLFLDRLFTWPMRRQGIEQPALKVLPARKREPRVLVADDNPMNRRIVEKLLEKLGCVVLTAENGAEVLARISDWRPDVILLDLEMPVLDGFETARRIRASGWHDLPLVALSAHVLPEEVERAEKAGMQGFLSKPVGLADLEKALHRWVTDRDRDS